MVGRVLGDVAHILVETPDGSWRLDETILFELDGQWIQLFVDVGGQSWKRVSKDAVDIPGDYEDLVAHHIESSKVVATPTMVRTVTEFAAAGGKVIACEVELAQGGFAITMDPEDCVILKQGEARRYCEQVAAPQIGPLSVRSRTAAQQTVEADGG